MPSSKKEKKSSTQSTLKKTAYGETAIQQNQLEKWPAPESTAPLEIRISYPEFTCLCPRSGYPDFATIHLRYRPSGFIVELKSLKLYLNSFRNRAISHEETAATLFRDLENLLRPDFLEIVADFNVRGNVKTVITLHSGMGKTPEKDGIS
ncbi:preQ(1) synthase [Leptospirillum ferriphilum]|jgi:7-cyano-7-deazaguanine reductase|uniref:NADPH-dependent 7-cyano-7-deazaguanine reductase n=2 Tax=Leptospirillum TaxID=179 RepID=A0A094W827_9BACT|nr:preQ(1) synthase [Leptospirillum ferriphilum]EDZ38813.1 MAG: Putative GTP cyclohydrolase I [Leptospirillum sp. Group II '5-way CG']KGA93653.1 NADPH-dependent 7-cyano-7-deazaguanine reductase [Leptospirillum ferriphilum]